MEHIGNQCSTTFGRTLIRVELRENPETEIR